MCADIKELCNDSFPVVRDGKNALQRRDEIDIVSLVAIVWHLGHTDYQQHDQDNQSDQQVGSDQYRKVGIAYLFEFALGKLASCYRAQGIKPVLNEMHRHVHTQ